MTVAELLGAPQGGTSLLAVIAAAVLAAARVIGKRAAASMQRQGVRIGDLEKTLDREVTRRRQVEECLRSYGLEVPYWPDDPLAIYAPQRHRYRYADEDQADDDPAAAGERMVYDPPTTEQRRPVPGPPSHRR